METKGLITEKGIPGDVLDKLARQVATLKQAINQYRMRIGTIAYRTHPDQYRELTEGFHDLMKTYSEIAAAYRAHVAVDTRLQMGEDSYGWPEAFRDLGIDIFSEE